MRASPLVLVTLAAALAAQVMRALFPLVIYTFGANTGVTWTLLGAYFFFVSQSPLLALPLVRLLGIRRVLALTVGGLAMLRLAAQLTPPGNTSLAVVTTAAVLALLVVPLAMGATKRLGLGILGGLALDAALNSAFLTWDPLWRRDALSFAVTAILSGLTLLALWQSRAQVQMPTEFRRSLSLVIGPFFLLELLLLQNPAFATSLTGFSLPLASAVVLVGSFLSLLAAQHLALSRSAQWLAALVWVVALLLLKNLTGIPAVVALLIGQAGVGFFLLKALTIPPSSRLFRASVLVAVGNLMFIVLLLLFHATDLVAMPLSIAPPLTGALIAFIVIRQSPAGNASQEVEISFRSVTTFPLILLVVPLGLWLAQPAPSLRDPTDASIRLFDYNIHQGANVFGWVDLEGIAAAIEAQNPDVVTLQEVTRGQLVNGSTDVAAWLSWRLGMPYYFAPVTTDGLGNALLTRLPILGWDYGSLPRGDAEPRSYLRARFDLGEPVTIIVTHLNHLTETNRIPQVESLLAAWDGTSHTIIVGDLNARPESTEIMLIEEAGFISAQDITGNSELPTFSSLYPRFRIDWIFGTPDMAFSDFAIPPTLASDHLPLMVTIRIRDE